jgi:hypothetical protein
MWKKEDDGDIYPVRQFDFEKWFTAGFNVGRTTTIERACNTCYHSNPHIINKCKKTKLCERYQADALREFDKAFYGTLCQSCKKFCKEELPKFKCDKWEKV